MSVMCDIYLLSQASLTEVDIVLFCIMSRFFTTPLLANGEKMLKTAMRERTEQTERRQTPKIKHNLRRSVVTHGRVYQWKLENNLDIHHNMYIQEDRSC